MTEHEIVAPPAPAKSTAFAPQIVAGSAGSAHGDVDFRFLTGRAAEAPTSPRLSRPSTATPLFRIGLPKVLTRPWCLVCAFDIEFPAGSREGSGWLAGPDTVITAGHNVFDPALGGWAKGIGVSPGQDDTSSPNGRFSASSFLSVKGWVNDHDPRFDYAMVRLPLAVGDRLGYFGYAAYSDDDLARRNLNIAGYPLYPGGGEQLHYHGNAVRHVSAHHLFYEIQTQDGESGSPVWIQEEPSSEPLVVAIHASGPGRAEPSLGIATPSGTRITPQVLKTIESWVRGA